MTDIEINVNNGEGSEEPEKPTKLEEPKVAEKPEKAVEKEKLVREVKPEDPKIATKMAIPVEPKETLDRSMESIKNQSFRDVDENPHIALPEKSESAKSNSFKSFTEDFDFTSEEFDRE